MCLDVSLLMVAADILYSKIHIILNSEINLTETSNLKFIKTLGKAVFGLLNLLPLEKRNFQLFCNYINAFYAIGFESSLNTNLTTIYNNVNQ
jgi:hypothetical protein